MMTTTTIDHSDLGNKPVTAVADIKVNSTILPISVSVCLCTHDNCTGEYTDELEQFLIRCACKCHEKGHTRQPTTNTDVPK